MPGTYRVTSGFGPRNGTMHRGIDFASATPGQDYSGARILAAADGVVVEAEAASGFGWWIVIRHTIGGQRVDTVSGHMYPAGSHVAAGQRVTRGQHIADVGDNGDTTGPHLHFEVWTGGRYAGTAVDPAPWLVP